MNTIKFNKDVQVELESFDDEPRERTFIRGEIIKAKVTRKTANKIDLNFYGDDIYGIDISSVEIL